MEINPFTEGAVSPPAGITPSFTNHEYVSGGIVPISAVFLTLSTLFLALRLYTKIYIVPPFRAEDCTIVTAWVSSVALTGSCLVQQNGRHLRDIPLDTFVVYGKWASATVVIYVPATALPKVAILIHYLRIYPEKNFRIVVYTVLSVTVGYMIAICLVLIFRCHPLAKNWNPTLPGHCILLLPYVWNGILNVMTDLMVILVPVPRLVAWKVTLRRKLVISVMLATGSLTCIVSAVRLYFIARMFHTIDLSRAIVVPTTLSIAESNLSVICGCLMVTRPFLKRHLPFLLGIGSERAEQTWPHTVSDEQALVVLHIPVQYRPKTRAGFANVNSSAGWVWAGSSKKTDSSLAIADIEQRAERSRSLRNWPLRNDMSPRSGNQDNIV